MGKCRERLCLSVPFDCLFSKKGRPGESFMYLETDCQKLSSRCRGARTKWNDFLPEAYLSLPISCLVKSRVAVHCGLSQQSRALVFPSTTKRISISLQYLIELEKKDRVALLRGGICLLASKIFAAVQLSGWVQQSVM